MKNYLLFFLLSSIASCSCSEATVVRNPQEERVDSPLHRAVKLSLDEISHNELKEELSKPQDTEVTNDGLTPFETVIVSYCNFTTSPGTVDNIIKTFAQHNRLPLLFNAKKLMEHYYASQWEVIQKDGIVKDFPSVDEKLKRITYRIQQSEKYYDKVSYEFL